MVARFVEKIDVPVFYERWCNDDLLAHIVNLN